MKTLKAGDLAPQFSLLNQDNQLISLSDFKGKKVLVYFSVMRYNIQVRVIRLHGQAVKTLASHAGIRGSIPLGVIS